ncbi:MAG: RapZ C-terminal domain-containing protein, partial [Usitatibacter sp.]
AEIGQRIDTSVLTPAQLRGWIQDIVVSDRARLMLVFESFGWKSGPPLDADFLFDVRFLPNPHYDPVLRPLTGQDPEVITFLERETQAGLLIEDIQRFLQHWLPRFVLDQRASITVAIGCTGGRHRSVYVADQLAERFASEYQVVLRHRDLKTLN